MRYLACAFLLFVVPLAAAAQSTPPLPQLVPDTRVRVWTDSADWVLKARVHAVSPQALELAAGAAAPRAFQVGELERVDVSRGRNRWAWTLGGMLVGATAGLVISRADNDEGDMIGGLDETAEGVGNTVAGALLGGAVGFFVAPERWRTVWRR